MVISELRAGDTVWHVAHTRMGNAALSTVSVYPVNIVEVFDGYVIAKWNGNSPRRYSAREIQTWKKDKPVLISSEFGRKRLATKSEIAEMNGKEG